MEVNTKWMVWRPTLDTVDWRKDKVLLWRMRLGGVGGKESTCQCRRHKRRGLDH